MGEALNDPTSASVLLVIVYALNFACFRLNDDTDYGDSREVPSKAVIVDLLYRRDDGGITSIVGYLQGMLPVLRSNVGQGGGGDDGKP